MKKITHHLQRSATTRNCTDSMDRRKEMRISNATVFFDDLEEMQAKAPNTLTLDDVVEMVHDMREEKKERIHE